MEDDKSTEVEQPTEQPAEDTILATLSDTEDTSSQDDVDETPEVEEEPEAEAEPEATPEQEEQEEEPQKEEPSLDPKEEARRRYEERQALKAEREARIKQQLQPYVDEAENDYDQRLRAVEVREYNSLVEANETKIISDYERVANNPELQIFNKDNPEMFNQKAFDRELRNFNAAYLQYDDNGNIIEVKGSFYDYLTEAAEQLKDAVKTGAFQQVKATKQMRSNADTKPAATPKEAKKDEILDILTS